MGEWILYAKYQWIAVVLGLILDFIFGDPIYWFHPIRLIGNLIAHTENFLRRQLIKKKKDNPKALYKTGIFFTFIVLFFAVGIPLLLLSIAYHFDWRAGLLLESIFCYQLLAIKSLRTESEKVYDALQNYGLEDGRKAVSMIVGRDTEKLDEIGVVKATVETIAENTSDGAIAPLFYMAFGGAALGFFYKTINTLDSMVGYKNEKYLYFGRFSAKCDDIVNYIPARLSAFLMILSCPFFGYSVKGAFQIWKRDSRKHASPNSAQTEAVCAGALGVKLAGDAQYFGKLYKKPFIGEERRKIEREDIKRANRLLYMSTILAAILFLGIKGIIIGFL